MGAAGELATPPTPRGAACPRLRSIELVANPLAGRVGPTAADEAKAIISDFGLPVNLRTPDPTELEQELRRAVDAAPDLLIVLAGDGTARAAASLCGPEGPLLAPLAGGTMNILPHALYGAKDWRAALRETLEAGVERPVSGGEAGGSQFYVAAILGPAAMWADAREAARVGRLDLALRKAQAAWRRAFQNSLRFSLDGGGPVKAEALTLICPLVSRALDEHEPALEAAAFHPKGPGEAARLGLHALLSEIIGDWRKDPAVNVMRCRSGWTMASGSRVHAILDGEPIRMAKLTHFRFLPVAFRALAPPHGPEPPVAPAVLHGPGRSAG